jgi:hypothetical protein
MISPEGEQNCHRQSAVELRRGKTRPIGLEQPELTALVLTAL